MSNRLERREPRPIADALWEAYGDGARLQAALSAYRALREEDLDACALWRDVLDLLEAKTAESERSQ